MTANKTKKRPAKRRNYQEDRLKLIFDYSPIAIWEEDFSALCQIRDEIKKSKVKDIRTYLLNNKGLVSDTFRRIKVLNVNKAALEMYGAATKKQLYDNLGKTIHRDVHRILVDEFTALLQGQEYFEGEFKTKTLSGKIYDVRIRVRVPTKYKRDFKRVIVTLQDISVQKKYEQSLKRLAQTDGLTEIYNHTTILKRLDEEFKRATRYDKDLSCLMVDLDHFKGINDLCGHIAGDKVLKKTADAIKEHVREVDVVGRYGGDEFLVILPETPIKKAGIVANRLISLFDKLAQRKSRTIMFSTVSIGISGIPMDGILNAKELLATVDKAMYKAKKAGRNTSAIIKA